MLVLLAVLVFVYHTAHSFFYFRGMELLPAVEFLYYAAFLCGVGWWIRGENRKHGIGSFYCDGVLIANGWLLLIPYYLWKTRGVRGFIPLLALIVVFVVAQFIGIIASVLVAR
jgi:hypothetical protein